MFILLFLSICTYIVISLYIYPPVSLSVYPSPALSFTCSVSLSFLLLCCRPVVVCCVLSLSCNRVWCFVFGRGFNVVVAVRVCAGRRSRQRVPLCVRCVARWRPRGSAWSIARSIVTSMYIVSGVCVCVCVSSGLCRVECNSSSPMVQRVCVCTCAV